MTKTGGINSLRILSYTELVWQEAASQQSLSSILSLDRDRDDDSESDVEASRSKSTLHSLGTKIHRVKERLLKEFESLQEEFSKAIDDLRKSVRELNAESDALKERCDLLERKVQQLEADKVKQAQDINKNERFSRRNNIRIVGYPTEENEECQNIAKMILEEVGVPACRLERAHRDGRLVAGRDRHLLVKLSFYQDKIMVMKKARQALAGKPYYIVDDLTKADLMEKRRWKKEVQDLFNRGTKLRFSGGCWRGNDGRPHVFGAVQ